MSTSLLLYKVGNYEFDNAPSESQLGPLYKSKRSIEAIDTSQGWKKEFWSLVDFFQLDCCV
jgi:hypothetical protein